MRQTRLPQRPSACWSARGSSPPWAHPVAIVAGYLVGNPVGGHVLSILHWFAGLRRLGYDVVFVEHHGWSDACWNPLTRR